MSKPYLVGITGGIGTGKSWISHVFSVLGAPIYNADSRARWLMENDSQLVSNIISAFGNESYQGESLNNRYLGKLTFKHSKQLEELNALVHPVVAADFTGWCSHQSFPYVIKEAALLFETGSYKSLDYVLLVTAPLELKIARIQQRDPHRTVEDIKMIMNNQLDELEAEKLADAKITNDETTLILPGIIKMHKNFLNKL